MSTRLDTAVQKLGTKFIKTPGAAGLSIGVYQNGTSHFYNFGTTEKGSVRPPDENTLYEIASITKTFAGWLLAKAAVEKKVNLTDDIRKYISGDYPNLTFAGQPIRLVHLANTTSGLPETIPEEPAEIRNAPLDSTPLLRRKIYGGFDRKDFFKALHGVKLDTIPGFVLKHSNAAAQLLTYILENVYKKPFEELVRLYILDRNGMDQTCFVVKESKKSQLAQGYNSKGDPAAPDCTVPYFRNFSGLRSSASDMLKYIHLQLDSHNAITRLTHVRTLDADASTGKPIGLLPDSLISANVFSAGLNWLIYQPEKERTQIFTDGSSAGFCSYIVFYPQIKSGIIVLTNKSDIATYKSLPGIAYEISKLFPER